MTLRTACLSLLLFVAPSITAQTTLSNEIANNTAACGDASGHCQATFTGMSDSTSGTYNVAPGHVSLQDMHELEYSGATTSIYAHFMPWFCMQSGSTAVGPGTVCNGHLQVGYNSNDAATVKAQMDDMQQRGFKGPVIDWYGSAKAIEEGTTQKVKADLEGRCGGGSCPMQFGLMEDQGSITRACPQNGNGTDQTNCILNILETDFDYMNTSYFPSPAYMRVDGNTMQISPTGRPVVFFFICESCFTNPSPNWGYVFGQLRQHVLTYTSGDPLIWFIFRNAGAFTHVESDGGFAWVNHYGSNDPYGLLYLDNFYDTALKYPNLQPWGAAWKGFDNTNAAWKPTPSITGQQCGKTWVQTFGEMTHNNDYSAARQLPFMQIVTWNDYEEGTEIETGIDNCLNLTASTDGTNLSWTTNFTGTGDESTVHHYQVYDSPDGETLNPVATAAVGTKAIPMNSLTLAAGTPHTLFVEAVGQASILNKVSAGVAYTPGSQPLTVTGISPTSGPTAGGTAVTITGQNFQSGATVTIGGVTAVASVATPTSITATTPAHAAGAVDVMVTNPDSTAATLAGAFTYVAPTVQVSGVSPNSGPTTGGTTVTITGQNFQTGAKVTIGGTTAAVSAVAATTITAVTPAHSAGTVSVTVTNPDGTGATTSSAFTYLSPSFVLSSSPTSRTVTKGTTASYAVSLTPKNGYTGRVNFSVSGLPSGATASFSPTYLTTSGTTGLSVGTRYSARGTFTLTVKGISSTGSLSSTVKVTLVVK